MFFWFFRRSRFLYMNFRCTIVFDPFRDNLISFGPVSFKEFFFFESGIEGDSLNDLSLTTDIVTHKFIEMLIMFNINLLKG